MRLRPWPLVVLAVLQLLAPAVTVLMSAWYSHRSPGDVAHALLFHSNSGEAIEVFLIPLLTAAAIYFVNVWSYAFLSVSFLWDLSYFPFTWQDAIRHGTLAPRVLCDLMSVGLYAYLLHPSVRATYIDRRLRWWQSKPRFKLADTASLFTLRDREALPTFTRDVSEGGISILLARSRGELDVGQEVRLSFKLLDQSLDLWGTVAYRGGNSDGATIYGIRFRFRFNRAEYRQRRLMRHLVRAYERQGAERCTGKIDLLKEFRLWWSVLLQARRGFLPELPTRKPSLTLVPKGEEAEAAAVKDDSDSNQAA